MCDKLKKLSEIGIIMFGDLPKLENLIDEIVVGPELSDSEFIELQETIGDILYDFISKNPLIFSEPNYETSIYEHVMDILKETIDWDNVLIDNSVIEQVYNEALYILYTHYVPRRSYHNTFIRKNLGSSKEVISDKLAYIRGVPQPEQCTEEWYKYRWNLISASSAWKAFGTQASVNSLIVEKCEPLNVAKYSAVNMGSAMHHGKKYEPLSVMYYEYEYGAKVDEFGCIPHKLYGDFVGASPDGIVVNVESDRYGRMVEIKNVVSRQITGIPKEMYWIQMQLQMEVCDLNECDFLEMEMHEYADKVEYMKDGSFNKSKDGKYKGVIIDFMIDGQPHYEYAPFNCDEAEFNKWERVIMKKYENATWLKNTFYRIDVISCVLVLRNKLWANAAIERLKEVWEMVLYDRKHGWQYRLPSKKQEVKKEPVFSITKLNEDIDIEKSPKRRREETEPIQNTNKVSEILLLEINTDC